MDCGKTINKKKRNKQHVCGEMFCKLCEGHFPEGHTCYMLREEETDDVPMSIEEELVAEHENIKTYIYFDFECTQNDIIKCDNGYTADSTGKCINCGKSTCGAFEHRPNLCIVHKVCTHCMGNDVTTESECEKLWKRMKMIFSRR